VAQQEYKFMKAVILAGGLGKRLRPLTNKKPKPMMPLGGKPILEHLMKWIKKNGIKEIVFALRWKAYLRTPNEMDKKKWYKRNCIMCKLST